MQVFYRKFMRILKICKLFGNSLKKRMNYDKVIERMVQEVVAMRTQEREEQRRLMQDQAIGAFNEKQDRRYRVGRAITITVSVLHLINAAVLGFTVLDVFRLILQFAPAVLLLCGVAWSRYVLAAYAVIDATLVLFVVCSYHIGFEDPKYTALAAVLISAYVLYDIVTSALLFTNKSISVYLYERKHRIKKIWE